MRAPAVWFSREWGKQALKNPIKPSEDKTDWRKRVSRSVIDVWKKIPYRNKCILSKKFSAPSSSLGARQVMLPCPSCGRENPVSKAGVYMRCKDCGCRLVSVKIRR